MKDTDPFNHWLDRDAVQAKTSVARSAPEVRDMLECAWAAARSVFGKDAKPEHAVTLLPHFQGAAAIERLRLQAEIDAQTSGGTKLRRKHRAAASAGH